MMRCSKCNRKQELSQAGPECYKGGFCDWKILFVKSTPQDILTDLTRDAPIRLRPITYTNTTNEGDTVIAQRVIMLDDNSEYLVQVIRLKATPK